MKYRKQIEVPASQVEAVTRIVCDLCKAEIERDECSVDDVEICRTVGVKCGHTGNGRQYTVDMCVACWESKLLPWLASLGVVPNVAEWGW